MRLTCSTAALLALLALLALEATANPTSHPYIPFRTSPWNQTIVDHALEWKVDASISRPVDYEPDTASPDDRCPLLFALGVSRRHHATHSKGLGIVEPPVIYPVLPSHGPGRQVLYTTQYEHLDMLSPSPTSTPDVKEALMQNHEYPMLFESSAFLTSPLLRDVNGDGILDAILTDYDGGIYALGLQVTGDGHRYFHKAQVPRMYIRRDWIEGLVNSTLGIDPHAPVEESVPKNETAEDAPKDESDREKIHDPFHTYFEYSYGSNHDHEEVLRGVSANLLSLDHKHAVSYQERKHRQVKHGQTQEAEMDHRRLQEIPQLDNEALEQAMEEDRRSDLYYQDDDYEYAEGLGEEEYGENEPPPGDDMYPNESERNYYGDDDYPRYDDYRKYDDYYGRYDNAHEDYYDDKHYIRVPPHILCTPTLAEFPKLYSQSGETEQLLFVAVSYYLDEDEYEGFFSYRRFGTKDHGDETEVQRGMYVANAIMVYQFGDAPRWGRQEHLDLSADHSAPVNTTLVGSIPLNEDNTKMGAFALSSPTVADIDGNGDMDVLLGTSMGFVYNFDARNLYKRDNWPVQFQYGIESRILVEDVLGDTNLEVFVADVGGNVACLDHKANKLWERHLVTGALGGLPGGELLASSPMMMGDVNGDGVLDIVLVLKIRAPHQPDSQYLCALSADDGRDLPNFPIHLVSGVAPPLQKKEDAEGEDFVHQKLPPPLLIDLHEDQSFLQSYLHRNGTKWNPPQRVEPMKPPSGGSKLGLHIVQPFESNVVIIEAASGCTQTASIGDEILTMVQADDVHGTGRLDLVISTSKGHIVTLESPAPYHPLNVWNNGETRGPTNSFAHGYSASQGIFIHDISRRYRDIFGAYIPITFEIFDNRPNIAHEPDKRLYKVDIRHGTSQTLLRKEYQAPGVYTERVYILGEPRYYSLNVVMKTTHGLVYEDTFHIGYNVNYMSGLDVLLWLPLTIATIIIYLFVTPKTHWDDDDYEGSGKNDMTGLLGRELPP